MAAGGAGEAAWVGYSMGGRYALHVALRHPGLVRRLVLVSATGGIDDPRDRAARRQADEALAAKVETEGVAAFVAWWLERPLFATLPAEAAAVDSRLGGTAAGLAASLRLAGTGTQQPLWSELRRCKCRSWSWPAARTTPTWRTAAGWRPASAATPPSRSSPAPVMPATWSSPTPSWRSSGRSWPT